MLGHFAQTKNISIQSYPGNTNWFNYDFLKYYSYGLNLGYNFKNQLNDLNVAIGAGFIHSKFSFGTYNMYPQTGYFESYDTFDAYGLGVSINYYLTFSAGITYKSIESVLSDMPTAGELGKGRADVDAIDYGLLLSIPVIKLIDDAYSFELSEESSILPAFNYNLGYSRLNIGKEVYYIDPAQADPLPLTARLGQTFDFGLNFKTNSILINLLNYDLILEAEDILIERNSKVDASGNYVSSEIYYQGMLGDINFGKHLIQLKSDDNVVVHKGHAISFIETVTILKGSYDGEGFHTVMKTDGLVLSTKGLFKFLSSQIENETIKFISEHLEIKYTSSTIFKTIGHPTDISGLSVSLSNFSFN